MSMLIPLLLVAASLAGDWERARLTALHLGRLVGGDTGTLVAAGGEEACIHTDDPMDCQVLRRSFPTTAPILELVPVDAWVLPAGQGIGASLLLPVYPYGTDEPVSPLLAPSPPVGTGPRHHVRALLPEGTAPFSAGVVRVRLLVEPSSPPTLFRQDDGDLLLPVRVRAFVAEGPQGPVVEARFPDPPDLFPIQVLPEGALADTSRRLSLVSSLCARDAVGRRSLPGGRHSTGAVPPSLHDHAHLVLEVGTAGQVLHATLTDRTWDDPELDTCILVNSHLLRLDPVILEGASFAIFSLEVDPEALPELQGQP